MHYIYIDTYSNYFLLALTIVVKGILINNTKNFCHKFKDKKYNKKNQPKSSDTDSFKYSILISLHYYDIFFFHPERISKLNTI